MTDYDALAWKHAWKIKAKEYRAKYFGALAASRVGDVVEIIALDDKVSIQRELLEEILDNLSFCPICEEYDAFPDTLERGPHAKDCRLAKEVDDV